ncbi:MAG: ATP-binding protein [Chitinophagaceae bacterium]
MTDSKFNSLSYFYTDESLNFIFETFESAVVIENTNRLIAYTNLQFCKLFDIKLSPKELVSTSILDNVKGFSMQFERSDEFVKSQLEIPEKKTPVRGEKWTLRNGKIVVRDYTPILNNSLVVGHIWLYREHKQIKALTNNVSYHIIENALNTLPEEIAIFSANAEILFANKAYINNTEKRLWARNKTLEQYFSYANKSSEIAKLRTHNILKSAATLKAISWQETKLTLNNRSQHYLRICYPVLNSNGTLESVIEQSIEITASIELERKLKQATDYMFATLNNLNDFVLQTDEELKLQFINKAWENMTGQHFEEYAGKSIFEILSVTRYELYQKMFAVLAGDSLQKNGSLLLKGKDGKEKVLQYNLQPSFNVNRNKQGIIATLSDVTSKQMQETQLLELVKREKELNELKTSFVNMVSHELRTPLTVISSSAEILDLMLQAGKSHSDIAIYTKQIIDEVEKMTAFMQDLLMVSKIEAGKVETNLKETDIVDFVTNLINNGFNPWKDGRNAVVNVRRTPVKAAIDSKLLTHALQNLLQNAFKYSSGKSDVKVRISFSKSYYNISVIDNGIGIPETEIHKLFTSFFRATNTSNISGTGIGLIVTKYFTEQHKGYVSVKSKMNKGSIFTIKLPYNK